MTHLILDMSQPQHERALMEVCDFCDARAGEPCKSSMTGNYFCPDLICDQVYDNANDALNCMMHSEVLNG